jgi:hypothetical protein
MSMRRNFAVLGLLVLLAAGFALAAVLLPPAPLEAVADPAVGVAAGSGVAPAALLATKSFRFAAGDPTDAESRPAAPPLQLTASDGTGLALVALEANAVLEPPLAFTELHLTFENPRDAVIEGRFRIALPPGAAISRFAMKIGGSWQEGEVVERQRARQAYEDFLHRRQDPALLEQEAGNEFSARVFPIPARGRKELIVSYSHGLTRSDEPYVLPLRGLAEIGRLDVRVLLGERPAGRKAAADDLGGTLSERQVFELHKSGWTPDRDVAVDQDRLAARSGLRHGNLAVVRVAAPVAAEPQEIAGLYVLVDSSAARVLGWAAQTRRLGELLAGLRDGAGGATPLGVAAFDQEVVSVYEGPIDGFGAAGMRRLAGRRPLGASDLHGALTWLAGRLEGRKGPRTPRVLLVTDGVATAGVTDTAALKKAVKALRARGVERLDVLAFGGLRDEAVLRELTTGNLPSDGQRLDGGAPLAEIARRLTLACRSGLEVEVDGAAWVWPTTLDGVQPGDEALVFADLPAGRPLRLALAGKSVALGTIATAERPLLERAWVQARIDRLIHLRDAEHGGDGDLRRALELQITEMSVKHRVLSPYTALLVLETEADYVRFGLERRGLADILTVGAGGLDVLARTAPPTLPSDSAMVKAEARQVRDRRESQAAARRVDAPSAAVQPAEIPESLPEDLAEDLSSLGYVAGGVEGGVEGGVAGGVAGGVVGGIPGGSPGGVAAAPATSIPPPPPPPPAPRVARPEPEADDAPLRVSGANSDTAERITTTSESPLPDRRRTGGEEAKARGASPYTGRFAEVMADLAAGRVAPARALAERWNSESPGDVLALLALGEAWEAAGEPAAAARAYGSLIDLFPSRADLRRLAGERLERLGDAGLELAIDTYQKAVEQRPDHPAGHRLLAWALLGAGRVSEAFEALEKGLEQRYPGGRFAGVDRVLREDFGLIAAAWLRQEPARREELRGRLEAHGARLEREPSLRFVLTWETDANDVDLHIWDRFEGHAYYSQKTLPSGGQLIADVTTGYGPECFVVPASGRDAAPYRLQAHYYSRGPMGYGMGLLQIVRHDGAGRITVEPRPFVVMVDQANVDLGVVKEGLAGEASKR